VTDPFERVWAEAPLGGVPPGPEFAAFQNEPLQMRSGAIGKRGLLRLGFERRGAQTVLAELGWRAPYLAQRALYCDSEMPDLPWLFLITTSGCLVQGDRLHLDVSLRPGARAHLTTQSAMKVHAMDANYALATQSIALDDRADLEYLPDPLLLHRHARFASKTSIAVAATATLFYAEIVQPGRKHHQPEESLGVTILSLELTAVRPGGKMLMTERLVLSPKARQARQTGVMDSFDVFGNVVVLTPKEIADRIDERTVARIDLEQGIAFGANRLPNEAGLVYKVLGRETAQVKAQVRAFWEIVRREAVGASIPPSFLWR